MAGRGKIILNGVDYSGSIFEPNPVIPEGATVIPVTNMKVDDDYYNLVGSGGTTVEGNPTVPPGVTPTALTGLKIDNDYYSISGGGGGGSSDDYSTTEHQVGTWIDNTSPVYEKTIYVASHNGGNQTIDNTLTNANVSYVALKEISYTVNNTYIDASDMNLEVGVNSNGVMLDSGNSIFNTYPLTDIYITIRYVKSV